MSLLPPLLFALWVRAHEQHQREPLGAVFRAFAFGATFGVAVAFLLNTLFGTATATFSEAAGLSTLALTAVIAAPVVEEATKGLGITLQRDRIEEPEDGLVYGAALGLGFAATENLLYGLTALFASGIEVAMVTVALRILSSTILHAGASAILGFGFTLVLLRLRGPRTILVAYLVAVLIHGAYNLLAITDSVIAIVVAFALAWLIFGAVRRRIVALDTEGA